MRISVKYEQSDEAQNEEKEQNSQEFSLLAGEVEEHRSAIFGYGSVTSRGLRPPNKAPFSEYCQWRSIPSKCAIQEILQSGRARSAMMERRNFTGPVRGCLKSDEMCRLDRKGRDARHIPNGVSL
jgi:hypothetical protein